MFVDVGTLFCWDKEQRDFDLSVFVGEMGKKKKGKVMAVV